MKESNNKKIAMRVSNTTIVINLLLAIFKLIAGIFAKSSAMISDAIHSASDVFSTFIVIIGFNISEKSPDKEHPYGHERMECVASIVLAVILFITGFGIGMSGVSVIMSGNQDEITIPGMFALIAAIVSIAVKEAMYRYTINASKKINSGALKADAWHHRSDALSSVGALIGIGGARLGYPILEPVASIVICLFILKAAIDIFRDAIDKMVDKACDDSVIDSMTKIITSQNGVVSLVSLQTRMFGSKVYVDAIISVDKNLTLTDAHNIAENVHNSIEEEFPTVKHCMVHVDPC